MTPDEDYFLSKRETLPQLVHMKLSKKLRSFPELFTTFLRSTYNFKHLQKKMSLIAYASPNIWTVKYAPI